VKRFEALTEPTGKKAQQANLQPRRRRELQKRPFVRKDALLAT